jgi:hypothetical protein
MYISITPRSCLAGTGASSAPKLASWAGLTPTVRGSDRVAHPGRANSRGRWCERDESEVSAALAGPVGLACLAGSAFALSRPSAIFAARVSRCGVAPWLGGAARLLRGLRREFRADRGRAVLFAHVLEDLQGILEPGPCLGFAAEFA